MPCYFGKLISLLPKNEISQKEPDILNFVYFLKCIVSLVDTLLEMKWSHAVFENETSRAELEVITHFLFANYKKVERGVLKNAGFKKCFGHSILFNHVDILQIGCVTCFAIK